MVEAAIADVVGPAVAADNPNAAPDEMIDDREQIARRLGLSAIQSLTLSSATRSRCARISDSWICGALAMPSARSGPTCRQSFAEQRQCQVEMLIGGQAEAKAEFRIVLEQRVRPCGAAALMVLGPRRDRQIAAIDRRAAGCIGELASGRRRAGVRSLR